MFDVKRVMPAPLSTLKPEEWRKVAYILARGARYQKQIEGFGSDEAVYKFLRSLQTHNEAVGTA